MRLRLQYRKIDEERGQVPLHSKILSAALRSDLLILRRTNLQVDPDHLKKYYSSLSDSALRELKREELVPAAQKIYDQELSRREPDPAPRAYPFTPHKALHSPDGQHVGEGDAGEDDDHLPNFRPEPEPDWLNDSACACSFTCRAGDYRADEADQVREALDAAGIPVYMCAYREDPPKVDTSPISEIRVMIPSSLTLEAESVLDSQIYNAQVEDLWRTHLATLSDADFRKLDFEVLINGLTDRLARLRQVYKEELSHRANRS
jgi:hypothetical protein